MFQVHSEGPLLCDGCVQNLHTTVTLNTPPPNKNKNEAKLKKSKN